MLPGIGTSGDLATVFTVSVFLAVGTFAALAAVTGDADGGGDGGTTGLTAAWKAAVRLLLRSLSEGPR